MTDYSLTAGLARPATDDKGDARLVWASEPASLAARNLVDTVSIALGGSDPCSNIWGPGRDHRVAAGIVIAALLRVARDTGGGFGCMELRPEKFEPARIGTRPFVDVLKGLQQHALLEVGPVSPARRWRVAASTDSASGPVPLERKTPAARLRASARLLEAAHRHGVDPERWAEHFQPVPSMSPSDALLVRRSSDLVRGQQKRGGSWMRVDLEDPLAAALHQQIAALNDFFAAQSIDPAVHRSFQRIFSVGDRPGFRWNKGGRLVSAGPDTYQSMRLARRHQLVINREPVVEIDIRASGLTILHGLQGLSTDMEAADPYAIPGIPRDVVKACVMLLLSTESLPWAWPSHVGAALWNKTGKKHLEGFPLKRVRKAVLSHLPVLKAWGKGPLEQLDLEYAESCIILDAISTLAFEHSIPALPVHDSIIVPLSARQLAGTVLSDAFERRLGVRPAPTISGPDLQQDSPAPGGDDL